MLIVVTNTDRCAMSISPPFLKTLGNVYRADIVDELIFDAQGRNRSRVDIVDIADALMRAAKISICHK